MRILKDQTCSFYLKRVLHLVGCVEGTLAAGIVLQALDVLTPGQSQGLVEAGTLCGHLAPWVPDTK